MTKGKHAAQVSGTVLAERERADVFSRQTAQAVKAEREYWKGVAAGLEPTLRRLFAKIGDTPILDDEAQEALAAMYGDRMTDIMTGKPPTRDQRRNTRAPGTLRSHLIRMSELNKRGLMPILESAPAQKATGDLFGLGVHLLDPVDGDVAAQP